MQQARVKNTRRILSNRAEVREAVIEVASQANRAMAILTHDLEPDVYCHEKFLDTVKRFVLARPFARIRVLIADPGRAIKNGNHFVTIGRRLNSYIEFRNVKDEFLDQHPEAYCIADSHALVYRSDACRWEGVADTYEPAVAKRYLNEFDELWHACEISADLRQLHL